MEIFPDESENEEHSVEEEQEENSEEVEQEENKSSKSTYKFKDS